MIRAVVVATKSSETISMIPLSQKSVYLKKKRKKTCEADFQVYLALHSKTNISRFKKPCRYSLIASAVRIENSATEDMHAPTVFPDEMAVKAMARY